MDIYFFKDGCLFSSCVFFPSTLFYICSNDFMDELKLIEFNAPVSFPKMYG
jgi:hypothetical protein